jgi:gliding motility-associated-like protein
MHQTPPTVAIGQIPTNIPSFLRPSASAGVLRSHFADTVVCQGTQLVYRAVEDPRTYEFTWYLNASVIERSTGSELHLNTSRMRQGTHRISLVVTEKGNKNVVNVVNAGVVVAETPVIAGEKIVCAYGKVVLNTGPQNPWWEYNWSTGHTTPELTVTTGGKYILTIRIKDGNCSVTDTFHVRILTKPTFEIEREQSICSGEALRLEVSDPLGQHRIRWSPGDHSGAFYTFRQEQPGRYVVRVEMTGCATTTEEVVVRVRDCRLRIPNFFTPNGDGLNDMFEIKGLEHYAHSRLMVTDRNGRVVFESNDYRNEWDGNNLPNGPYFYVLYPGGDEAAAIRGHVTIRR